MRTEQSLNNDQNHQNHQMLPQYEISQYNEVSDDVLTVSEQSQESIQRADGIVNGINILREGPDRGRMISHIFIDRLIDVINIRINNI